MNPKTLVINKYLFKKMMEKIKNWWKDYKQKKSLFSKLSDLLFVALVLALLFPSSRMWVVSHFQRLTMWGPSELPKSEQVVLPETAFDWKLIDLNAKEFQLSDFKGKVLFVNFWATWCPPCVAEMPSIQKLYEQYKKNDSIVFILATSDPINKVKKFLEDRDFDLPIYLMASNAPKEFFSKSIPATFLVDKRGKIVMIEKRAKKWHGQKAIDYIDELIDEE